MHECVVLVCVVCVLCVFVCILCVFVCVLCVFVYRVSAYMCVSVYWSVCMCTNKEIFVH